MDYVDGEDIRKLRSACIQHLPIEEIEPSLGSRTKALGLGISNFVQNKVNLIRGVDAVDGTDCVDASADDVTKLVDEYKTQGCMVGGDMVFFAPTVTQENAQAVLDSMQFAQRVANKKIPNGQEDNTVEWYKQYCDVLLHIGWPAFAFRFAEASTSGKSFAVNTEFLKIVTSVISDAVTKKLNADKVTKDINSALDALEKTKDGKYSKLFSSTHNKARDHSFSVGFVTQDPGVDTPILFLSAFELDSKVDNVSVLWVNYGSNKAKVRVASAKIVLNKKIFEQCQPDIQKKLGVNAKNYVASFDDLDLEEL